MSKVIILKTQEEAGEADIRVMIEVDLMNQLVKVKRLLEDRGFFNEAQGIGYLMGQVRKAA